MGLTRAEKRAKAEEIAEFSELGEFLNLPIRAYSRGGMALRLFFSIATGICLSCCCCFCWRCGGLCGIEKRRQSRYFVGERARNTRL